jgi:hypothetical protein
VQGPERLIADQCQSLLSKLVKVLQATDQPLKLLYFFKVDASLALKVFGIVFSVVFARLRGVFGR